MAPSKAVAWPDEIYGDQDVTSLDEQGRFIICRVCAESFEVYGGKTPKPVTMNACFRTRAWETHKRRTRAHRKSECSGSDAVSRRRRSSDPGSGSFQSVSRQSCGGRSDQDQAEFLLQAAAARSDGMHGFNTQYTPLTVMIDLAVAESLSRCSPPSSTSFVHLLETQDTTSAIISHGSNLQHQSSAQNASFDAVPQEQANSPNHEPSGARDGNPLALDSILNPVDWKEEEESKDNQDSDGYNVNVNAAKRQRTSRVSSAAAGNQSSIERRSANQDLYWKTMREVFSCGTDVKRAGPRSQSGDVDADRSFPKD